MVDPPVESDDPEVPEVYEKVGVVAVAEEDLWIGLQDSRIQIAQHRYLVTSADARHDRGDLGVGEGRVNIGGTFLRRRTDLAGCRVLHRLKLQVFTQPLQAQVLHVWEHPRTCPRRRQDGHFVARFQDRRTNKRRTRKHGFHPSHREVLAPVSSGRRGATVGSTRDALAHVNLASAPARGRSRSPTSTNRLWLYR